MKQKLLILGGSGLVGSRLVELLSSDFELITPSSSEIDLSKAGNFEKFVSDPANSLIGEDLTIINFVAFTNVDGAENEKGDENGLAYRLNAQVPGEIAEWCEDMSHRLIHFSTEYIFDGAKEDSPYTEEDSPNPLGWYGKTKLQGDNWILESIEKGANCVILRITMPFRANLEKKGDLARGLYNRLKNGQPIQAISDGKITPLFIDDLVKVIKGVLAKKEMQGIYNIASTDSTTLEEFVRLIADKAGLDQSLIATITFEEYWKEKVENGASKRPKNSWLDSTKIQKELGIELPTVEKEIEAWLNQLHKSA
jgi:dTDP-4-dehydrorhamnose reductase